MRCRTIGALIFSLITAVPSAVHSQGYPNKPIRAIIPFAAGTTSDISARQISAVAEKILGQPIVIDNRPGAGATIAASAVARSSPDGHTLLFGTAQMAAAMGLYKNLSPTLLDFAPVARLALTPTFLAVNASLPIKSVADLVEYARKRPDELTFASTGNGTASHLQGELLNATAGIRTRHIPYRSATQGVTDLATGTISLMFYTSLAFDPFVQTGQIRMLAITGDERFVGLPEIPTIEEAGIKGFVLGGTWVGLFAPAQTPKEIVDRLHSAFSAAMDDRHLVEILNKQGITKFTSTKAEFARFIPEEIARYKSIIDRSGARIE